MADGNDEPDPTGVQVEEDALERYYQRRLREIADDERPTRGRFVPAEELRRIADEHEGTRTIRP
jgi:hypothetical protein